MRGGAVERRAAGGEEEIRSGLKARPRAAEVAPPPAPASPPTHPGLRPGRRDSLVFANINVAPDDPANIPDNSGLGPSYHEFSIAREPLRIEGPFTTLRDAPGLGVEVDWECVERHRIDRG